MYVYRHFSDSDHYNSQIQSRLLRLWLLELRDKMSLRTLDSFFGISQKRKRDEETDNSEKNSSEKNKENVPPAKKARDTWNAMWIKQFPWLEKLTDNDGKLKAVCSWCKKFGRTNSMATQGTPNLQSSTFSRHESTKDHLLAVQAHHATEKKVTAPILVETQIEQELDDESDSCKEAQFRTMYYVSKEGQPLHQYNNVITLQVRTTYFYVGVCGGLGCGQGGGGGLNQHLSKLFLVYY